MQHGTQRKTVQHICITLLCSCFLISIAASFATDAASDDDARWWPVQAVPKAMVRLEPNDFPCAAVLSYAMMAQSVAGLAAKAVNEGSGDELVWVGNGNANDEAWLARLLVRLSRFGNARELWSLGFD